MPPHNVNPYAPTEIPSQRQIPLPGAIPKRGSVALTLVALFGLVIWAGFVAILFGSNVGDRVAAKLLLINTPAFLGLTVTAARSTHKAALCGIIAASVQLLIMAGMLVVIPGADIAVVTGVNTGIAVFVLALTFAAWGHSARSRSPGGA